MSVSVRQFNHIVCARLIFCVCARADAIIGVSLFNDYDPAEFSRFRCRPRGLAARPWQGGEGRGAVWEA